MDDNGAGASRSRVLVVVHPGSACGSADFHHGARYATEERASLADFVSRWSGDIVVIDSDLSGELAAYPSLDQAIRHALDGALAAGHQAIRTLAGDAQEDYDDSDWVADAVSRILPLGARHAVLTGAWYHPDDDGGCVNAVYDALIAEGMTADVDDSALPIDLD